MLDPMTIFLILVEIISRNNGLQFHPTISQTKRGMQAISVMIAAGTEFPFNELGIIWTISCGDQTDVEARYGSVPGFNSLLSVLNEIKRGG